MKKLIGHDLGSYTFDATGQTITLGGLDTLSQEQLLLVTNTTDGIVIGSFADPNKGMTISSNVITLEYDTTSMSDTDAIQVYVDVAGVDAVDYDLNANISSEISPVWTRYTSPENLVSVSDIGATDDTWIDQGSEIQNDGYKTLAIYCNFTVNDSITNEIQILSKHESAGADEYVMETPIDYQKTIGDASIKVLYTIDVEAIPYIQIQTKAATIGATEGTITIDIVKIY